MGTPRPSASPRRPEAPSRRPAMGSQGKATPRSGALSSSRLPTMGARPVASRPSQARPARPSAREGMPLRSGSAAPGASARRRLGSSGDGRGGRPGAGSPVVLGAVALGVIALVVCVALLVMSRLPVFTIEGIDAQASEHVSADTIAKLAGVEEGTTLLNVDVGKVQQGVRQNPWVKDVSVRREFPSTLGISVTERTVFAVVVIGSGASVWALGDDGVWIEPVQVSSDASGDVSEAALDKAKQMGCLLINQVPTYVDPSQGAPATDDVIQAVLTYQQELDQSVSSEAQTYNAASTGSLSLVLKSGLEIALGGPTDVASKQAALTQIMNQYPGQLTYVNVRVPSKPSYRKVSAGSVSSSAQTQASTAGGGSGSGGSSDGSSDAGSGSDAQTDSGDAQTSPGTS